MPTLQLTAAGTYYEAHGCGRPMVFPERNRTRRRSLENLSGGCHESVEYGEIVLPGRDEWSCTAIQNRED
jgi:hypothetical protein